MTSSSAGMSRMRSTGVTVSTFSGFAASRKFRYRDDDAELLPQVVDERLRGLAERARQLALGEYCFQSLDRIREITVHVVASHA